MKKVLFPIAFLFVFLTGFEHAENLEITKIETTVIEANHELRYDFEIKNNGNEPIKSEFDYPGNQPYGIELVVKPNEKLAKLMEIEGNTEHQKMRPLGSGSRGFFEANSESYFHVSYQIKNGADFDKVKKHALDSSLLILDGIEISVEFPLKNIK
ncbi:hypothetical protein [Oceanobacillus sp. Castelsardo]|uniref:hypothetical protein n=1 Tax=Oceanobacillus sp. Castelsardo TaxID=1851204 RepID=UPI00083882F0|nr:hypothetical protein [Oceanobacillus sp. Castelsardo]